MGTLCAFVARPAWAHAILEASDPAQNTTVPAGRRRVTLRFNSRIVRSRSSLLLTRPDKSRVVLTIDPDGTPETLTSGADLTEGPHVLRWQVLALDGHITRGDVPFRVTG